MSYAIETSTVALRAELKTAIETVWITTLGYAADTIEWPNLYFTKPGNGPWIRVSYPQQSTFPYTWGAGIVQNATLGLLSIQIFMPKNIGTNILDSASDALRSMFERKAFGAGIRFREAQGPNETFTDNAWRGVVFSFPFEVIEDIAL